MKKILLAATAAIALSVVSPAIGQVVFCANCATVGEQVWADALDAANWIRSIENQVMQIEYEIRFWQSLVINTVSLPQRIFSDITGEVRRIESIAQEASFQVQQTKNMIQHLGDFSGGYYYGGSLDDIPRALYEQNVALSIAMQKLGSVIDQTQLLRADQSDQLATLASQSDDAAGIKAAVQAGNQLMATAAQNSATQSTVLSAGLQALGTAELRRADREALLAAASQKLADAEIKAACGAIPSGSRLSC